MVVPPVPVSPCDPPPCGSNAQCQVVSGKAQCSCLPNMIGVSPNCRPECVVSSDCPSNRACVNQKCVDPCPGSCGQNSECRVYNHRPACSCQAGFTGDAFNGCRPIPVGKSHFTYFYISYTSNYDGVSNEIITSRYNSKMVLRRPAFIPIAH